MEGRHLISPNLHVIMVHFPLGIFVFGLFLEVFSFLWRRSTVRLAARWMILFGGLFAVPAALSGIDAYTDVMPKSGFKPEVLALLQKHVLFTSIGAGLAALGVTVAIGLSDHWRKRLYFPVLLILIAGAGLMMFGAHFGGEGVYLGKVAVAIRGEKTTGFEYYVPARSTHVLAAGLAIAMSLGALGTSLRALSTHQVVRDEVEAEQELAELEARNSLVAPMAAPAVVETRPGFGDAAVSRVVTTQVVVPPARVPSSRFWLLGALLFLVTLGLGVWYLVSQEQSIPVSQMSASRIVYQVRSTATADKFKENRRGFHIVLGCCLVIMPLILAAAVRWAAGSRFLVGILCAIMVLATAFELWIGILLIRDSPTGPLFRYKPEPTEQQASAAPSAEFVVRQLVAAHGRATQICAAVPTA